MKRGVDDDDDGSSSSRSSDNGSPSLKRARCSVSDCVNGVDVDRVRKVIDDVQVAGMVPAFQLLYDAESRYGASQLAVARIVRVLVAAKVFHETPLAGDTLRGDRPIMFLKGKPLDAPLDLSRLSQASKRVQEQVTAGQARVETLRKILEAKNDDSEKSVLSRETLEQIVSSFDKEAPPVCAKLSDALS